MNLTVSPKEKSSNQRAKATFSQFILFKANLLTLFRLILVFLAVSLYAQGQLYAALTPVFVSVVLDYLDGYVARRSGQCSFFGETIDWLTDVSTTATICQWLSGLQPRRSVVYLLIVVIQLGYMGVDLVSKARGHRSLQLSNKYVEFIFKITKSTKDGLISYSFIGYWNEIHFYLCLLARVCFLSTGSPLAYWLFLLNLPLALTYPLNDIAEATAILEAWTEIGNGQEIVVDFQK